MKLAIKTQGELRGTVWFNFYLQSTRTVSPLE